MSINVHQHWYECMNITLMSLNTGRFSVDDVLLVSLPVAAAIPCSTETVFSLSPLAQATTTLSFDCVSGNVRSIAWCYGTEICKKTNLNYSLTFTIFVQIPWIYSFNANKTKKPNCHNNKQCISCTCQCACLSRLAMHRTRQNRRCCTTRLLPNRINSTCIS